MSRRCQITGTKTKSGHKVSHSNHKNKRTFRPNLQTVSITSDALGQAVRLRVTAATIRTIDHNGGLDAYLLSTNSKKLEPEAVALKRKIKKAKAA